MRPWHPAPRLHAGESIGGVVTLVGRMPSGRQARFEVSLDGKMAFDLDGYEGRACAGEMERIQETLQDRFRLQLGPPQIHWKDEPRRISKGARDLPCGGVQGRGAQQ